jgi:hypothetical protein
MKTPCILLFLFLIATSALAQSAPEPTDPIDLVVIEKRWHKEIRNPALDEDPFAANDEHQALERAQKDNAVRNARRIKGGESALPTLPDTPPVKADTEAPSTRYAFRIKVRNTGSKIIRAVVWDYFFFNPETLEEAGHRSFTQKVAIRPGKGVELIGHSNSPPVRFIDATKPVKGPATQYSEKIVIQRVDYSDGTFWLRPL